MKCSFAWSNVVVARAEYENSIMSAKGNMTVTILKE
jgi:hypothetical protein